SIRVGYKDNFPQNFYYNEHHDYVHLVISYQSYEGNNHFYYTHPLMWNTWKEIGWCTKADQKVGVWKYYDKSGILYKTVDYMIPRKKEKEEIGLRSGQ